MSLPYQSTLIEDYDVNWLERYFIELIGLARHQGNTYRAFLRT